MLNRCANNDGASVGDCEKGNLSLTGSPQHYAHSQQTHRRSDPIIYVRDFAVYFPSPQHRQHNEDSSVSRIDPTKMWEALKGGNDSIHAKDNSSDDPIQ